MWQSRPRGRGALLSVRFLGIGVIVITSSRTGKGARQRGKRIVHPIARIIVWAAVQVHALLAHKVVVHVQGRVASPKLQAKLYCDLASASRVPTASADSAGADNGSVNDNSDIKCTLVGCCKSGVVVQSDNLNPHPVDGAKYDREGRAGAQHREQQQQQQHLYHSETESELGSVPTDTAY